MSTKTDFGTLALGQPLQLYFSTITDPIAGTAYTDLSNVVMKFTVKEKLSDTDASAVATVTEEDGGFVDTVGSPATLALELITNAISETLTAGKKYYFDGWLKDSNNRFRPFNFGTAAAPSYIGYFTTAAAVTDTKD